ncbi:MAG: hypothetical protein AB8B55_23630 [Mariniblastus sp.]
MTDSINEQDKTKTASASSNRTLTEQLIAVRKRAQLRLVRFANLSPEDTKEIYLFNKDEFCGVRFTLGAFRAVWRLEETCVSIFRGETQIDRFDLDESAKRAA